MKASSEQIALGKLLLLPQRGLAIRKAQQHMFNVFQAEYFIRFTDVTGLHDADFV